MIDSFFDGAGQGQNQARINDERGILFKSPRGQLRVFWERPCNTWNGCAVGDEKQKENFCNLSSTSRKVIKSESCTTKQGSACSAHRTGCILKTGLSELLKIPRCELQIHVAHPLRHSGGLDQCWRGKPWWIYKDLLAGAFCKRAQVQSFCSPQTGNGTRA